MPLYSTRDERFVRHVVSVPSACDLDSLRQAIDRADADRADAGLPGGPDSVSVVADESEIRLVFVVTGTEAAAPGPTEKTEEPEKDPDAF